MHNGCESAWKVVVDPFPDLNKSTFPLSLDAGHSVHPEGF